MRSWRDRAIQRAIDQRVQRRAGTVPDDPSSLVSSAGAAAADEYAPQFGPYSIDTPDGLDAWMLSELEHMRFPSYRPPRIARKRMPAWLERATSNGWVELRPDGAHMTEAGRRRYEQLWGPVGYGSEISVGLPAGPGVLARWAQRRKHRRLA